MSNNYDKNDMVDRVSVLKAGALKIAAYRVRDLETMEWSSLQFHMTYNNTILAKLEEEGAKLLCKFIEDVLPKEGE